MVTCLSSSGRITTGGHNRGEATPCARRSDTGWMLHNRANSEILGIAPCPSNLRPTVLFSSVNCRWIIHPFQGAGCHWRLFENGWFIEIPRKGWLDAPAARGRNGLTGQDSAAACFLGGRLEHSVRLRPVP